MEISGYYTHTVDGVVYYIQKGFLFSEKEYVWKSKLDKSSGKTFYSNQGNGAKKWSLPESEKDKKAKKDKKDKKDKKSKKEDGESTSPKRGGIDDADELKPLFTPPPRRDYSVAHSEVETPVPGGGFEEEENAYAPGGAPSPMHSGGGGLGGTGFDDDEEREEGGGGGGGAYGDADLEEEAHPTDYGDYATSNVAPAAPSFKTIDFLGGYDKGEGNQEEELGAVGNASGEAGSFPQEEQEQERNTSIGIRKPKADTLSAQSSQKEENVISQPIVLEEQQTPVNPLAFNYKKDEETNPVIAPNLPAATFNPAVKKEETFEERLPVVAVPQPPAPTPAPPAPTPAP
eukprot:PhF_6_TR26362/c0_g1_i1/m.37982